MNNSRREAAYVVARWLQTREFPAELLPQGETRAFVQDVVYTVLRHLRALRRILGEYVTKWPKGELEAFLYVGAAQLLYMDVAEFAATHETVEAAKSCGKPTAAKVVNAVMRRMAREKDKLLLLLQTAPLEVRESFPTRLAARWVERFGELNAEQLMVYHNLPAVTYLARPDGSFVTLERGVKVEEVPGYQEGEFIVQDPAHALAIELLSPQKRERILDACAAPGGKTIQIAWRGAQVTACEVNPKRRKRLEENLARVSVSAEVIPSLDLDPAVVTYDKVLVDAPCSNTGVLRRRPDARWNWNEEKFAELVKLQAEILDQAARLVKPGGVLVYATCSNEPEENEGQVAAFLARHPDFKLEASRESLPFETNYDGAFAAKLVKSKI